MSQLLHDLRYGVRMLAKTPGFTVVAILTLRARDRSEHGDLECRQRSLIRPLPYHDPDRLVIVTNARGANRRAFLQPGNIPSTAQPLV